MVISRYLSFDIGNISKEAIQTAVGRDVRRWVAAVLVMVMIGLSPIPVSAQEPAASAGWSFSPDYTRVEIGGKVYENIPILLKRSPTEYQFINLWADYLTDLRDRATRSPEEEENVVRMAVESLLSSCARQSPDVELVLLGSRPWQEHALAGAYLRYLPPESYWLEADPTIRGYLAEVLRGELSLSDARVAPRDDVVVVARAYHLYRSPAEMKLVDGELAPDAREDVRVPYREFAAQIGAEWPEAWDTGKVPTKQVEVVLYLDRDDMTVYENRGTAEERSEVRRLDQPPVAPEGHTLIPARAVFEAFGATVTWRQMTQDVLVETLDRQVTLAVDSPSAGVWTKGVPTGFETLIMKVPAQVLNNRMVIPLRFVAEALGYEVDWHEPDRRITVRATVLDL